MVFSLSLDLTLLAVPEDMQHRQDIFQINKSRAYIPMSLERFISRRTLITMVLSLSLELTLFAAPKVRSTDKIFRRPKS